MRNCDAVFSSAECCLQHNVLQGTRTRMSCNARLHCAMLCTCQACRAHERFSAVCNAPGLLLTSGKRG